MQKSTTVNTKAVQRMAESFTKRTAAAPTSGRKTNTVSQGKPELSITASLIDSKWG